MFHADYNNSLSAATLSLDSVGEMMGALRRISAGAGIPLNAPGRFLCVAPEQEAAALSIVRNAGLSLSVVSTTRLTAAGNYYLFSDPELFPAVATINLEGSEDGVSVSPGSRERTFASGGVCLSLNYDVAVVALGRAVIKRATS